MLQKDELIFQIRANREDIIQYFAFRHLPPHLQEVSKRYAALAIEELRKPRSAERTVALRKLLEAKDAAVRAVIYKPIEDVDLEWIGELV